MAKAKDKKKEEEAKAAEAAEGAEGAEGEVAPKKKGLPMMFIIIGVVALLVVGGGGAAAYFFLLAPKQAVELGKDGKPIKKDEKKKEEKKGHGEKKEGEKKEAKVDPKTQPVIADGPDGVKYFTLPDTTANIQGEAGRQTYLKLRLTFECADEDTTDALSENMPRINDTLQGFLNELHPEDIEGSQGNFQLRLEILRRINLIMAPHKINAVLIQEMLVN